MLGDVVCELINAGVKIRNATIELPMAGRWKIMVEVPQPVEIDPETGERRNDKYRAIYDQLIDIEENPNIQ